MNLFWYKRKVKETKKVKDDEGKLKDEIIEVIYWDCFNPNCMVRAIWRDPKTLVVLLNDGHEQATDQQTVVATKKGGQQLENRRVRDWVHSEIELDSEDAERLWRGKMYPSIEVKETEEAVVID